MEYGWNFAQHCSIPVLLSAAPTVFRCVASRNKRGPSSTAPGFRDGGNNGRLGDLGNVGREGNSWSASINDINGIYLLFDMQRLHISPVNRSNGFQLRCLSE